MNQKPRSSNKNAIAKFFSTKVKIAKPAPKFQIGDYIINTKFKVISKIINIIDIFDNEDRTVNYDMAQYVMVDIKNDARDALMMRVDQANGSGNSAQKQNAERKYKRRKPVHAIDPYYNKINPGAAQALYGIKLLNEENNGTDDQCD